MIRVHDGKMRWEERVDLPLLVRVDDRLLHGQVTVGWRQHLQLDEIWVVDDAVRADPFLADVLCTAAPAGVTVRVYAVSEAIAAWSTHSSGPCARPDAQEQVACSIGPCARLRGPLSAVGGRDLEPCACPSAVPTVHPPSILLLVKSPQVALALAEGGLAFPRLNVGNIAPLPGSRRVFRTISLAPEHVAALDTLAQRGVSIIFQLTPDDSKVDWQTIRRQQLDR